MQIVKMDAALLKKCFLAAAANVEKNKEFINELNVFPVPDGDTGTNVSMTLMSAVRELSGVPEEMEPVCRAISQGTLRGARGNSGVIFSQLLRGFTKAVREKEEISSEDLAAGFRRAAETAYKAVMKPKEGTILTVARGMSERIQELAPVVSDLAELSERVTEYGFQVLDRTPEMLPVLKEAGVVDSGGMALMKAIQGVTAVLTGKEEEVMNGIALPQEGRAAAPGAGTGHVAISTDEIRFGYCTECIINLKEGLDPNQIQELRSFLLSVGDSVVCVEDEGVVKIHVHTNHPGLVFEKGLELGSLSRLKVDNLHEEHEERLIKEASKLAAQEQETLKKKEPSQERAVVAVCAGPELAEAFRELGAAVVIEGGQTMNPSIEDILVACEKADAKEVFVLPNNKNIILASQQAENNTDGRFRIITIPTKTVVQGVTALLNFDPTLSAEETETGMKDCLTGVKSGEVTYAIRNTSVDGVSVREGDIMGIGDQGILAVGTDLNEVTLQMIGKMADEGSCMISVWYGSETPEETAAALDRRLKEAYPMLDVDVRKGGQPVYYYFTSVE